MTTNSCNSQKSHHFIELGKIGRPHGIRGEVRLFLHNPESDMVHVLNTVFLSLPPSHDVQTYSVRYVKESARFHILSLKGIHNREKAQQLNGMLLKINRDELPDLEEGEFYVADLMGIDVICNNQCIGKIVESRAQGGIEVITVANEFREIQIPLVDDYVVHKDISSGIFEVHNIEDLPVLEFAPRDR